MARTNEVPAGFTLATYETEAAGVKYPVQYLQAESVDAYRAAWEAQGLNPDEVLLGIVNAAQKQGATQGNKTQVRDAVESGEQAEIDAAVAAHQESTAGYLIGAPRGGSRGGPTKKAKAALGEKIAEFVQEHGAMPTKAQLEELGREFGIVG